MPPKLFENGYYLAAFFAGLAVAIVLLARILFQSDGRLALYFFDIGQGDSQLVEFSAGGVQVLIDGGPSGRALLDQLSRALPLGDRYIDLVVMTHPQLDHFGGFIDMLKHYDVGAFISTGRTADIAAYRELDKILDEKGVRRVHLKEGDSITYGDAIFSVLGPSPQEIKSKELNDTGIVLLLKTPEVRALYTADIGEKTEARLAKQYDLNAEVLKVGHHGSKFSSSAAFLKEVSPEISVIGVGKNTYGHPTKETLGRLAEFGGQVLRTDKDGLVRIIVENGRLVRK